MLNGCFVESARQFCDKQISTRSADETGKENTEQADEKSEEKKKKKSKNTKILLIGGLTAWMGTACCMIIYDWGKSEEMAIQ